MVVLNGKKFAETDQEFIDSLFLGNGTCIGYCHKKGMNTIHIKDHNKNIIGFINAYGVLAKAFLDTDKNIIYSYGDIDILGEYKFIDKTQDAEKALYKLNITMKHEKF